MADDLDVGDQGESKEEQNMVHADDENVSESPEGEEHDVSIWNFSSKLFSFVVFLIMYLSTGFLD
jgi:hypothetical protein